jgi:hypothetical protein
MSMNCFLMKSISAMAFSPSRVRPDEWAGE